MNDKIGSFKIRKSYGYFTKPPIKSPDTPMQIRPNYSKRLSLKI